MSEMTRQPEGVVPSIDKPAHDPGNQAMITDMTSSNLAESERVLKIPLVKNHPVIENSKTHGIAIGPTKGGEY